ncbi:MAG: hypothetical protein ACLVL7_08645 [Anaerotruncus massiliensis (ex Togo et al. 2019)]
MKRIVLSGCNGKMGRMIASCVKGRDDCTVVAGIDVSGEVLDAFPVFTSPAGCQVEADVIIDFSHPSALAPLLDYAAATRTPAVIATTGLSSNQSRSSARHRRGSSLLYREHVAGVGLLVSSPKRRPCWAGSSISRSSRSTTDDRPWRFAYARGRDLRRCSRRPRTLRPPYGAPQTRPRSPAWCAAARSSANTIDLRRAGQC